MPQRAFAWAAFYGLALSALILSGNVTPAILGLFLDLDQYTLGKFGQVWANWHAIGCAFAGFINLSVAVDDGSSFLPPGRAAIARCTAFIFGTWGVQNTYYCLQRTDLFTPLMWLNAIGCLLTAAWSGWSSMGQPAGKSKW